MEIIKHGLPPYDPNSHLVNCLKCNTVISFLENEANFSSIAKNSKVLYIKCPKCGHQIKKDIFFNQPSGQSLDYM